MIKDDVLSENSVDYAVFQLLESGLLLPINSLAEIMVAARIEHYENGIELRSFQETFLHSNNTENSYWKDSSGDHPKFWKPIWANLPDGCGLSQKYLFLINLSVHEHFLNQSFVEREEARYRFLFDNVPVSLWEEDFSSFRKYLGDLREQGVSDLESYFRNNPQALNKFYELVRILDVNRNGIELNGGKDRDSLIGPLGKVFQNQSNEMLLEEVLALVRGENWFDGETSRVNLDGRKLDMRVQFSIPDAYQNSWEKVLVSTQDITHSKQNERALREAAAQNKQLMKAITSILICVDVQGQILHWNERAEHVLGLSAATMVQRTIQTCPIPWDQNRVLDAIQTCQFALQQIRLDDLLFQRPSGGEGFLGLTLNPMLDETDHIYLGCLILGADITERKHLETQLLQAQKMESIGQLAAGIAHEINTPTQYLGDNIRFLQESFTDIRTTYESIVALLQLAKQGTLGVEEALAVEQAFAKTDVTYLLEEIPLAIQQSLEGVERVSTIVKAMKEFSHPGSTEKTPIDINHAIENTLTVARNEWKYVADVQREYATDLPLVPVLPGEFNQVILNLITNAAHAISAKQSENPVERGVIKVKTFRVGNFVEIQVADTGTGIPERIRNKVFDPFFTTKEVGRGTGQGLTIAYDVVVEKHNGELSFESEEGQGTTFIIRLPLQVNIL